MIHKARKLRSRLAHACARLNLQREKRPIKWAIIEMLMVWGLIAATAYWAVH